MHDQTQSSTQDRTKTTPRLVAGCLAQRHRLLTLVAALGLSACGGAGAGGPSGADQGPTGPGPDGAGPGTPESGGPADQGPGPDGDVGGAVTSGNPFAGAHLYVNPDYVVKLQSSIEQSPADAPLLEKLKSHSNAISIDRIARVASVEGYLDDALAQQEREGVPVTTVFVIYDLPGRDCAARASNGELSLSSGDVERYRKEFIDPLAAAFKAHGKQRIVAIIEPDSLPNLATNMHLSTCAAADPVYRDSVAYAIHTLAAPNVYQYIDAAHAGWLGWPDNQHKAAVIFQQVIDAAGGPGLVRGFATNVANYTVLQEVPERFDYQFNPCHDELTYVRQFSSALASAGLAGKNFLIDTSRNGRGGIRGQWGYWCNNEGAGVGERPRADPAPGVDAYYWVKPVGESDGTSDPASPRFDAFCGYEDAAQNAPNAGEWFHSYLINAARNASPPL